jgi:hypothetical protein
MIVSVESSEYAYDTAPVQGQDCKRVLSDPTGLLEEFR